MQREEEERPPAPAPSPKSGFTLVLSHCGAKCEGNGAKNVKLCNELEYFPSSFLFYGSKDLKWHHFHTVHHTNDMFRFSKVQLWPHTHINDS